MDTAKSRTQTPAHEAPDPIAERSPSWQPTAPLPAAGPVRRAEEDIGLEAFRAIDRMREALLAQFTGGLSPASLTLAYFDWFIHLAAAPGKRMELVWKAVHKAGRFGTHLLASAHGTGAPHCIEPLPGDDRFSARGVAQASILFLGAGVPAPRAVVA